MCGLREGWRRNEGEEVEGRGKEGRQQGGREKHMRREVWWGMDECRESKGTEKRVGEARGRGMERKRRLGGL